LLPKAQTPAPVLVVQFVADRLGDYQRIARRLRDEGIGAEVYPDAEKLGPQLQYAEKKGVRLALIAAPEEFAKGAWKVKDMTVSRDDAREAVVPESQLVAEVRKLLV